MLYRERMRVSLLLIIRRFYVFERIARRRFCVVITARFESSKLDAEELLRMNNQSTIAWRQIPPRDWGDPRPACGRSYAQLAISVEVDATLPLTSASSQKASSRRPKHSFGRAAVTRDSRFISLAREQPPNLRAIDTRYL